MLKKQVLWTQRFDTIEDLRLALLAFKERYNTALSLLSRSLLNLLDVGAVRTCCQNLLVGYPSHHGYMVARCRRPI